jgi:hypothetical protein
MMNTKTFFVGVLLFIAGCKKDSDDPINTPITGTPEPVYTSLKDFYDQNGPAIQIYTVSVSSGGTFTTPSGTEVVIPSNAFSFQNGTSATGDITIRFKDLYKRSDMILSGMTTTGVNGLPLSSGGEFYFEAISGDETLKLKNGKRIDVKMPKQQTGINSTSMRPYVLTALTNSNGWNLADTISLSQSVSEYLIGLINYDSDGDSGIWTNCDQPIDTNAFKMVTVIKDPLVNPQFLDVLYVYQSRNAVGLTWLDQNQYNFYSGLDQLTIVAYGLSNGKLFAWFYDTTVTQSLQVNMELHEMTAQAFKDRLRLAD